MTKKEAETLQPGDTISCAGNPNRLLTKVWIENQYLSWYQYKCNTIKHSYPIDQIIIVSRAKKEVINNYELY